MDPVEPSAALTAGTKLGPYEVAERLGRGGMGIVYRGVDTRLGREVALKVLATGISTDERRRRFFREARSAASVNHRHVATLYDVGEADGRLFLAMELVRGTTLRAHLATNRLSVAEAVRLGREIALGVSQAHEKGIVHRDLKPENVMVAEDGSAKVLDFGLAKLRDPISDPAALGEQETETREGVVMGTPGYMAPEQESGRAVDLRTDVYALGLLLHEMVTGARPGLLRSGPSIGEARLAKIVRKCIAPNPADRWADAREVERALGEWEAGRSGGARARTRMGMLLAATAALCVLVAIGSRLRAHGAAQGEPVESGSQAAAPPTDASSVRTVGLLDNPDPVTKNPGALAQYRLALTDLRDARRYPQTALQKAIDLDPDFSAAHLRLAFSRWQPSSARDYGEAVRTRERLDARDRELLEAEAPLEVTDPPDLEEGERRFRAVLANRPGDVEVLLRLAWIQGLTKPDMARASYAAAAALDRSMAAPYFSLGRMASDSGDIDEAARQFQSCVQLSPTAGRCMMELAETFGTRGDCSSYFQEMRRAVTVTPDDSFFNIRLLEAMVTSGRSEEEVRGQLATRFSRTNGFLAIEADRVRVELAIWSGDFDEAAAAVASLESGLPLAEYSPFLSATLPAAEESGDESRVSRLLKRAFATKATRPFDTDEDRDLIPGLLAHHTVTPEAAAKLAATWRGEAVASGEWRSWELALAFEAPFATTPSEAQEVVARDASWDLPPWLLPPDGLALGRLLLLAGRPGEARDRLQAAASSCRLVAGDLDSDTAAIIRASYDLGRADEALHDIPAACAAYQRVLDRWGHAKPRSVTADAARKAAARLGCAMR